MFAKIVALGGGNLANNITLLRILLVPAFIGCLFYYSPTRAYFHVYAVAIFVFACFTDALDGMIARRFNQKTVLGSYIDPIADKLLLTSGFLSCSMLSNLPSSMHIPAWVTISVISRDVIILIGSVLIFVATGHLKAEPLYIGKVTTVLQMSVLFSSLLSLPAAIMQVLFVACVLFTVLSGVLYIRMGEKLVQ